ncbi:MAG: protein kinase domain-containing protein [Planctomycetota bacterium]
MKKPKKKGAKKFEITELGPYTVARMIGKGGMGAVFEATRKGAKKRYALKILLPAVADTEALERFKREVEAGKELDHPGIVKIHEIGYEKGKYFFAMDFVDGKPLDKIIDGEGIAPEEGARIMRDAAEALAHAHAKGIIHRDIKPNNIILSKEGKVFITDFGIARQESSATLTADGQILGTPFYMSPEQATGRRKEITPGSDIYSLGITFYELLTRTTPFRGEKVHEIIRKILTEDPIPPSLVAGGVPKDLEMVVMKAIRKEIPKRYPSAEAFVEDLDRFLEGKPVLARPLSTQERLVRSMKRHKGLYASGAVAAILIFAFIAVMTARGAAARSRAMRKAKAKEEKVQTLVTDGEEKLKAGALEKAREAFEEALALNKKHGEAFRGLAATQDEIKKAQKRRDWAQRREEAASLARKGAEAKRPFLDAHVRRMAFMKRLEQLWQDFGPEYESSQVNAAKGSFEEADAEAQEKGSTALDLFEQALLLDPASTEAHQGIASLRMAGSEAEFRQALWKGDFTEVKRSLVFVDQHDQKGEHKTKVKALREWMAWDQPVEIASNPAADEVTLFRTDLREGSETSMESSSSGRFRVAPGSYVAELKKKGYVITRLPFVIEWPKKPPVAGQTQRISVKLLLSAEKYEGMIYIPEGEFIMGGAGGARAGPRRREKLPAYFIDRTEVTAAAYKVFLDRLARKNPALLKKYLPLYPVPRDSEKFEEWMQNWKINRKDPLREEYWNVAWVPNPDGTWSPMKGQENRPVGGICYEAANAFAKSFGKRLPTSVEWEKAARGVDGRRYPWGMQYDEFRVANMNFPNRKFEDWWGFVTDSLPEGASPYGCLHMAGNLAEWTCTDFKGDHKVNRGGGQADLPQMQRCSSIDYTRQADQNPALGFRCVRDVD